MATENLVDWSDDLSIGIPEIDKQHKVLVGLLNTLHAAIREHKAREECGDVLEQLVEYTRVHFATEESVMSTFRYPELERHRKEHQDLIDEVTKFRDRFESGQVNLTFEVLHFLKNWLSHHIVGSDKAAGEFITRQGTIKKTSWLARFSFRELFGF